MPTSSSKPKPPNTKKKIYQLIQHSTSCISMLEQRDRDRDGWMICALSGPYPIYCYTIIHILCVFVYGLCERDFLFDI